MAIAINSDVEESEKSRDEGSNFRKKRDEVASHEASSDAAGTTANDDVDAPPRPPLPPRPRA